MYHIGLEGLTGEGASQGLLFHLIASFFTGESRGVPEGCCCWIRWRSGRSGRCDRSSLIEPGSGVALLIYLWPDDVTDVRSGLAVLCSLYKMAVLSHKMAVPFSKMAAPLLLVPGSSGVGTSRSQYVTPEAELHKLLPPLRNDVHIVSTSTPPSSSATGVGG